MFRLEKLEIAGFKSFYDSANLTFPAAMTAVVGPNGCGKSNICDAIIWVLGENRASHIRGETMEDVIFQGSARRRPLGMGEVTLTLRSDNGHPAADDGRITLHRRVFRTGESEFRLNGKRVRMKDISDILMDTGLGIRNYSVMEQGKIDLILSNKPQDRRRLIEEAAGITKYKTKRRAAELKLDETQANLLRIDDTLAEVTRNLGSLKRQASKARRHKELSEQLSTAKRSLYAGRVVVARAEEEAAGAAVIASQNIESELAAQLGTEEAALAETRVLHAARATSASAVREEMAGLSADVERLRSFLQQSETNLGDLVQRIENATTQTATLEAEGAEQQALLDEKSQALDAARSERNRLREVADQFERERQERSDEVRRHEKALADAREMLMRTIAKISEARNQVHQIEIAVEKCEFYLTKLGETARKAAESRDNALQTMADRELSVRDAEANLQHAQQAAREAIQHRDELTSHRDERRALLASARDTISQTTYKIDSQRALLASLEAQDENVRRVILELIPSAVAAAEAVRAAEGYEAALDTLLREISKAVVVENANTAAEAIARLHERGAGRGAFITLDYQHGAAEERHGDAADAIRGEGAVADAIRAAVPEAYVVDDLQQAIEQAQGRPRATFVTRSGDIVRGPLMFGGKTAGATPGLFSIKRELADLEALLGSEEVRASGIWTELQQIEEELRIADDVRIIAEEHARMAEQDLRERRSHREHAGAELERFEKDLAVASEERTLYEEEKEQLIARKNGAIQELEQLVEVEAATHEQIREHEDRLAVTRSEFEEITETASRARVDVEAASGNVNAIQREHENLSRVVASLVSRGQQFAQEIETLTGKKATTESAIEDARSQLDASLTKLHALSESRIALEAEVADLETRVQELESRAIALRDGWNAAKDALFEAERRLDRAKSAFELLREQVSLDLHAGIDALAEVEPPQGEEARAALDAEVTKLADQIEKIGPVNVLAIEEHQELEQREIFLRTQRDDLVQAIESLRTT
ncbi:MAG TPA: chromosome segregation protein SMC, partial [Thermoanaerobaculia bacterium]|nr:chromosome segregation protein SMC [Thermoanaerobaculia bacterium]